MERFARVCPTHHQVLEERRGGRLRCPRSRHRVGAWLVVDVETGEVLGAGRDRARYTDRPAAVFLGPRLQLAGDVVLDRGARRYALPLPARPAAA